MGNQVNIKPKSVNTALFFYLLLHKKKIDTVIEIGSRDGRESLKFKMVKRSLRIHSIEANEDNYQEMIKNKKLQDKRIQLHYLAISDYDGQVDFKKVKAKDLDSKGNSSILQKIKASEEEVEIQTVECRKLDSFIQQHCKNSKRIALWIDVEGFAWQVLNGLGTYIDKVVLIHTEVELKEFWEKQKLKADVSQLCQEKGFYEIANDNGAFQQNAIYVNEKAVSGNFTTLDVAYRILRTIQSFVGGYSKFFKF